MTGSESSTALPRPIRLLSVWIFLAGLICVSATNLPLVREVAGGDSLEDLRSRYESAQESGDLKSLASASVALAQTKDPRAISVLAEGYAQPAGPRDQVRYLLAGILSDWFRTPEETAAYAVLRTAHAEPRDAWLWYRSLSVEPPSEDGALVAARSNPEVFLRAAAVEALAYRLDKRGLGLLPRASEVPRNRQEQYVQIAALAGTLDRWRVDANSTEARTVALCLARLLDDPSIGSEARTLIARYLAAAYRYDGVCTSGRAWAIRVLGGPMRQVVRPAEGETASFFGIPCAGSRIVYLLDMSDSMNDPLEDCEWADVAEELGRVTTPSETAGRRRAPPPRLSGADATRFDAARVFLLRSLRSLPHACHFAVVGFGSSVGLLTPGPGLVPATTKNVDATIERLTRAQCGIDGDYGASTNLHGAFRLAYRLTDDGPVEEPAYVDLEALLGGAAVFYVLTDGVPTDDDWSFGKSHVSLQGRNGTYADPHLLLADLQRMNLFRKAEIHCVGIGVSTEDLLVPIARIGLGRVRIVGERPPRTIDARGAEMPGDPHSVDSRLELIEDIMAVDRSGRTTRCTRRRTWVAPRGPQDNDPCHERPLSGAPLSELGHILDTGTVNERIQAIWEVGCRGCVAVEALPWVFRLLRRATTTGFEAGAAMQALPRLGPSIEPYLRAQLADDCHLARVAAAGALGRLGNVREESIRALESALRYPDLGLRATAATALGRLGPEAKMASASLLGALEDLEPEVRVCAAGALVRIGVEKEAAFRVLRRALKDPDCGLRLMAQDMLKRLDEERD